MDFADILLKRIDGEHELKKPFSALICFSKPKTGIALVKLMIEIVKTKPEKSSIAALNLIDEQQASQIEDEMVYKTQLFSELVEQCEKNRVGVRTFVKKSDDFVNDILATAKELNANLILLGIGNQVLTPDAWQKYVRIKDGEVGETPLKSGGYSLKGVSTLLMRNPVSTGIFIENNFNIPRNIFTPLLHKDDVSVFPYLFQLAQLTHVKVTVWDAIGIIETDAKVQKIYQYILKKTDNRVVLWDNDKKIDSSFINNQDLVIIGITGWDKLIGTSIPWVNTLPSTLIIKEDPKN